MGGVESVSLTAAQLPGHGHQYFGSTNTADQQSGANMVVGTATTGQVFRLGGASADFAPAAIGPAGKSLPHSNVQPYQCVNYIIALEGIFPPRS
jgi:microcystin-dependent protein